MVMRAHPIIPDLFPLPSETTDISAPNPRPAVSHWRPAYASSRASGLLGFHQMAEAVEQIGQPAQHRETFE